MKTKKIDIKRIEKMNGFHSWKTIGLWMKGYNGNRYDSRDVGIETIKNIITKTNAKDIDYIYIDYYTESSYKREQISKGFILGDKSPSNYNGDNCLSKECKEKYGPKGCGYCISKKNNDQDDIKKKHYRFHDNLKNKITEVVSGYDRHTMQETNSKKIHINNLPDSVMENDPQKKGRSRIRLDIGLSEMDESLYCEVLDMQKIKKFLEAKGWKIEIK